MRAASLAHQILNHPNKILVKMRSLAGFMLQITAPFEKTYRFRCEISYQYM